MARYLKVNHEFYKIDTIKDNIVTCYQYNDDCISKSFFIFDLKTIENYELWN